jgi:hypothetical protein
MKTKLSQIKLNSKYNFNVVSNTGAGSGSQCWYNITGMIKEINAEFIRVVTLENLLNGNNRSVKLYNRNIVGINALNN